MIWRWRRGLSWRSEYYVVIYNISRIVIDFNQTSPSQEHVDMKLSSVMNNLATTETI